MNEEVISRDENTPLLAEVENIAHAHNEESDSPKWTYNEEETDDFSAATSWRIEAKKIGSYTAPLALALLLQYSLTVTSIFTVGHLGTVELGAASLASTSANLTGYLMYIGLSTALDTLCPQAYGSGKKHLVGLHTQRMVYFLWVCTVPIGALWMASPIIFKAVLSEPRTAELAGRYLQVVIIGAPGIAAFESGMRYVQAQGLFSASLYVLLICAPLNAILQWLFVWHWKWGFVGAPIAVAITQNILPILLAGYIRYVDGWQCWPGLTFRALHNWGPMVRLAIPGLTMVISEWLAFEALTLASTYLGTTVLAAQSVLATVVTGIFHIPFSLSIATSTRVANLIGAANVHAAKIAARTGLTIAVFVALMNFTVLFSSRNLIPRIFTNDRAVWRVVESVFPICIIFQLFDAVATTCGGMLRGLGRQKIGGYVQLFCYYTLAMPISMGTAFGAGWGLFGLWSGFTIALALVLVIEVLVIFRIDWDRSVNDAAQRNSLP